MSADLFSALDGLTKALDDLVADPLTEVILRSHLENLEAIHEDLDQEQKGPLLDVIEATAYIPPRIVIDLLTKRLRA